jgi:hypothetical protein
VTFAVEGYESRPGPRQSVFVFPTSVFVFPTSYVRTSRSPGRGDAGASCGGDGLSSIGRDVRLGKRLSGRLVGVSPELQPFPPSPMDEACVSFGTHDNRVRFLPTRPLRNRRGRRQSPHRHPPKLGAQTTIGLVRRVYEEGSCRIKRHCAACVPFGGPRRRRG